jgi:hypothetical protein
MITLDVRSNLATVISDFKRDFDPKQMAFATALALTRTAQDVRAAEYDEMRRVFDRPTPFTMRSLFLKPATRQDLTARVWFKEDWAKADPHYLITQVHGGARNTKRVELWLRRAGILPPGWFITPGEAAKLDAFGNISRGQLNQVLSWFGAQPDKYANTSKASRAKIVKRMKGAEFFWVFPGSARARHLQPGIYLRYRFAVGSAVKPVLIFVRTTSYTKRFDFYGVAKRVTDAKLVPNYLDALRQARATAR